jgi:CheY-like chemotaxis protein
VQPVDLPPIIEAALETVRPAAAAKGIRLQPVLDSRSGSVSGDPSRLQQVLWNLLSNAIKFTPRDGRVQVILQRVDSHVEIKVIDDGEGIHPGFLPHVFDRFRQADSSATRSHGGLGLGLAIVRQLAELHGGTIQASSAGPNQGSTFTLSLPLLPIYQRRAGDHRHPKTTTSPLAAVPRVLPKLDGVRVLVVDDEPDARALATRLLSGQGATVTTAENAADAFRLLREIHPDVLVSDIGMPGEDGLSFIKRVRDLPEGEGGNTPALALTAYARMEDRMNAILAGFQMHIVKPVEAAELLTMVGSLAGKRHQAEV